MRLVRCEQLARAVVFNVLMLVAVVVIVCGACVGCVIDYCRRIIHSGAWDMF